MRQMGERIKQNIQISVQLKFRNKTVFGLFTVTVTNSVAVFLVRTRFQNGFLCDFIAFNYYKVVFLDFCFEYKHKNGKTFSPDLELKK
jgi:hypothetical protein